MSKINTIIVLVFISALGFSQTRTDANGKKQGYWKKKDDKSNQLIYEGLFIDNKPQGVFKYYHPNDSLKAIMNFKQDGKYAYSTLFHLTGKKMASGKYIGEDKDSVWSYFDDKGVLISKETYALGRKNGKEFIYFTDGVISEERSYKDGKLDGLFTLYYDKGLIKSEGTYINGLLEGKNTFYFPNGVTAATGYYKNGSKIGPWIYRDKKGKITEKELYKLGGISATEKETTEFFSKHKPTEEKPKTTEVKEQKTKAVKKTGTKK
jgi:antitoxin component YwqK of YwqJK toxin-antitoxin module